MNNVKHIKRKKRILTEEHKKKIGESCTGKGRKLIPIGTRFGRLVVVGNGFKGKHGHYCVKCKCDCGNEKVVEQTNLRQEHTTSCGCVWKETVPGRNRLANGEAAFRTLYNNYSSRAKRVGIEFSLDRENFRNIVTDKCYYCGQIPNQKINSKYSGPFIYNGIDRMDNRSGYTNKNSVSCCWTCNNMKKSMNYQQFVEHITKIAIKIKSGVKVYEEKV